MFGSSLTAGGVATAFMPLAVRNSDSIRRGPWLGAWSRVDHRAYWNRIQLGSRRSGKSVDNGFSEACNSRLRRECLTRHWFAAVTNAHTDLAAWRQDYLNGRWRASLNH